MGRGYTLKCPKCDFAESFKIGTGANQEQLIAYTRENIIDGLLGSDAREFLSAHPGSDIIRVQTIYRCNRCGDVEERSRIQVKDKSSSYTIRNFCSHCKGRMGPVPDVQKLHCPTCKVPVEIKEITSWN